MGSQAAARPGIQVIARAAAILRVLEHEPEGLSLGQVATRVKLARSTVQRIVGALTAEHLLIAASPTGGVKLGPAIVRLALSANVEVDRLIRPALVKLAQAVKETVDLSVLQGHGAVFIDQVPGSNRLRAVSAVGESFPVYCTANGKALLSVLPDEDWIRVVSTPIRALTPRSITSLDELRREIQACRQSCIAYDREEHTEGITAVGTAFLDPFGRPMAVSIPVPTARFARLEARLIRELHRTRREIGVLLGK